MCYQTCEHHRSCDVPSIMSQIIPGGRPRASSDGDILDEGLCGTLFVNLNDNQSLGSRKNPGKTISVNNNATNSSNNLDLSNDAFDSDSELSSQSQTTSARSRRRHFSFKSMRKAVSRAFVKDSKTGETASKKSDKSCRPIDLSKVWTPDLRFLTEKPHNNEDTGTMSTARPLITDPSLGMTVPKWKKTPGITGIYNHGNSCFMNAVLQCLSNIDSFTEYFVRDFFKNDLKNSKNGKKGVFRSTHGEVTEQLGHLLKCLWSGSYSTDVSKEFKAVVGKFNSQYKGDHQHDAQEFLLWLLDRIHEDVSIFSKKKFKAQKAQMLKSDEELALEAASANGESFVLKLFQALHSSTLICPTCGERSSTFDPYLCVSLPLPQRCPRIVYVIVVSLESHHFQEVKMAITLNQFDGVRELREHVGTESKIPAKQLLLVQLKEDGFGATYSDEQPLSDIPENETVYAIETYSDEASMLSSTQEFETCSAQVLVVHAEVLSGAASCFRFGSPTVVKVRRDISLKSLQKEILNKMEDRLCKEILSQKLTSLFSMRIYDGSSRKHFFSSDVDMPLYTQSAERAFSALDEDFGPTHIKIVAEWEPQVKKKVVLDDQEHIEIHPSVNEAQGNPPGQGKVSLEECFKLYTQEEKLIGDDAWLCPHCKQQQQGTIKTLGLWSLPEILVLHLKRFKQTGGRRSKLNTLVEFPVDNLDMSSHLSQRNRSNPFWRDDYTYDLFGVSNHYGNMMGGHYTAYCRSPVDGEWRVFNDHQVHTLDGPIATKDAYLLFYQRRSLTKAVNQRLFTGDHWVFSLNLALSDRIEKKISISEESALRGVENNHQPRQSRSCSASPPAHHQPLKEGNGVAVRRIPTRPLTPQLPRRTIISCTDVKDIDDDSSPTSPVSPTRGSPTRRSRLVQRQASEPSSHFRREKSAGGVSSTNLRASRTLYNRSTKDEDSNDFLSTNLSKKTTKTELNGIGRSQSQTRSRTLDRDGPTPSISVIRHDIPRNDLSTSTYKNISHQSYLHNNSLESDAKYPSSTYDHTKYKDKHEPSSFDLASSLQVRLEDSKDRLALSHPLKPHFDPSSQSDGENARRRLAQLIKQSSLDKALAERAHINIDTIEEEHSSIGNGTRMFENRTSFDMAKHNSLNSDYLESTDNSHTTSERFSQFPFDKDQKSRSLDYRLRDVNYTSKDSNYKSNRIFNHLLDHSKKEGYSTLKEDLDDYSLGSDYSLDHRSRSEIKPKLEKSAFVKLAEEHFGPSRRLPYSQVARISDDTSYGNSDYISPFLNGDTSRIKKYATIGRTMDTAYSSRYEQDGIPRSYTDHSIHYNPSLLPPPSPTPPHSLREERSISGTAIASSLPSSTSDYLTSDKTERGTTSIYISSHNSRRSSDQEHFHSTGARTLPGYSLVGTRASRHNFRPPRGVWGVKPKPTKSIGSIPTPCLRESSV